MSAPARKVRAQPTPVRTPVPSTERARPSRTPAARPRSGTLPHPNTPPHPRRRARRRPTPAFWVLTVLVVTGMVVAIVSLSALSVQASFRVDDLRARIGDLSEEQRVLTKDVTELSAPSRVVRWARGKGMVMPERVVILRLPPTSEAVGAGE